MRKTRHRVVCNLSYVTRARRQKQDLNPGSQLPVSILNQNINMICIKSLLSFELPFYRFFPHPWKNLVIT